MDDVLLRRFELLTGNTPFQDDDQPKMFRTILKTEKTVKSREPRAVMKFPAGFDAKAEDLVRQLCTPNATFRLGMI